MTQYGRYDPTNTLHGSSLFSYGETPLESSKLNRWNANIAATLDNTVPALLRLLGMMGGDAIVSRGTGAELQVTAQDLPNLSVRVQPGDAVIDGFVAGLTAAVTLPQTGAWQPPATLPRRDAVCLDTAGTLDVLIGEESAVPLCPVPATGSLKLAEVYWYAGASAIYDSDQGTDAYIVDTRPSARLGSAHVHGADRAPAETPNGTRTQFATASPFVAATLDVYLNGLLQTKDVDYTEDAGAARYSFATPPQSGDVIQHRYIPAAP